MRRRSEIPKLEKTSNTTVVSKTETKWHFYQNEISTAMPNDLSILTALLYVISRLQTA